MKKTPLLIVSALLLCLFGCNYTPSSTDIQRDRQEKVLQEAAAQVGIPNIVNFREMRILKDIQELCDQEGIITYTYIENLIPTVVHGHTALGGKFTFFGETIGYGIPYATQFTAPETMQRYHISGDEHHTADFGVARLPQAEPSGLHKPESAEGTWVLINDPAKKKAVPVYIESRITTVPFKFPMD